MIAATLTTVSMSTSRAEEASTDPGSSPQVVESLTTDTEQVTDNQDGTYTLSAAREPVRAYTSTGWQPLDLTLHQTSNGRIAPAVTANPVTFSGGGTGATATFAAGDATVSFSLPTTLPAPHLDGPTAIYSDVYPDVDLQLTATPTGFTDTLVVHNATAAANPAVAHPNWSVTSAGISLDVNDDGTLSTTRDNATISTDVPTLWDSATGAYGPTPSSTDTGTGQASTIPTTFDEPTQAARTAAAEAAVNGSAGQTTTVTLSPDPAALAGPDVHYPIYIDPGMSATKQHTLTVSSGGVHAYDSSSRNMQTGWCNWAGCGSLGVARAFFSLNTTALTGKATTAKVFSASISVQQLWSAASAATPVDLWSTSGFSSATKWPGPAKKTKLDTISSAAGYNGKNPGYLKFSGSAVTKLFQSSANSDTKSTTFGLIAPNERDAYEWKQFARNPVATITYGFPPATPSKLRISPAVMCPGKTIFAATSTPTIYGTTKSYNPSNTPGIGMSFLIDRLDDGTASRWKQTKTPVAGANTTAAQEIRWSSYSGNTTSTAALPHDISRYWHVRAQAVSTKNGTVASPWSGNLTFAYDINAPSKPTFSINSDGSLKVHTTWAVGVMWSTTEQGLPTLGQTTCDYNKTLSHDADGHPTSGYLPVTDDTATIPASVGPNRIYLKAFDGAHNLTAVTTFDPTP